uniref:H/ACA ribonucleoprotein complex subunit n=1 Tax=Angiostrongylus cantonensis TaxID=6313 RepID=A0A0K0DKY4_ANGCA
MKQQCQRQKSFSCLKVCHFEDEVVVVVEEEEEDEVVDIEEEEDFVEDVVEVVIKVGEFTHTCENDIVCKCTCGKIPFFNAPIYFQNKEKIGKIDEIFGSLLDNGFSVTLSDGVKSASFKLGQKLYIDPAKLMPIERFLPGNTHRGRGRGGRGRGADRGRGGRGDRGGESLRNMFSLTLSPRLLFVSYSYSFFLLLVINMTFRL